MNTEEKHQGKINGGVFLPHLELRSHEAKGVKDLAALRRHIFKTREAARAEIFDYLEVFYDRARRHQHLGNISPADYEQQMVKLG